MPIYHHFYIECRGPDGWVVPPSFEPESWTFGCNRPFGEFEWVHPQCGWLDLFFGQDALFPMRPGPPDERRDSPLLRHLDRFYDYGRNEDDLCWLPYPELFIDVWETDLVTVQAKVPARHALLFGDGRQRLPGADLRRAEATEGELDRLYRRRLAGGPVDVTAGRERFRLATLPADREVTVTWQETIAEFFGELYAPLFTGLRRYGPDEELRILSRRG